MEQWAEKVDEDLRCATEELQFWREQRTQHVEKMDQVGQGRGREEGGREEGGREGRREREGGGEEGD